MRTTAPSRAAISAAEIARERARCSGDREEIARAREREIEMRRDRAMPAREVPSAHDADGGNPIPKPNPNPNPNPNAKPYP